MAHGSMHASSPNGACCCCCCLLQRAPDHPALPPPTPARVPALSLVAQVILMNDYQKHRFVGRVLSAMFNTISKKKIAVYGFAFKKDTGDTRETPAIDVCKGLMADGANVSAGAGSCQVTGWLECGLLVAPWHHARWHACLGWAGRPSCLLCSARHAARSSLDCLCPAPRMLFVCRCACMTPR